MLKFLYNREYDNYRYNYLTQLSKGNEWLLKRMSCLRTVDVHKGCVNSVVWDEKGEILLSGSDDQHLVLSNPWTGKILTKIHTSHRANIFSAKFLPYSANRKIVSCCGGGHLLYTDLDRTYETAHCKFDCHDGTCYDVITLPDDSNTFLSCGEDGTVRWFDLRTKTKCSASNCKQDILLNLRFAVTAVAINPLVTYQLAVATRNSKVSLYDRRMLGTRMFDSFLENDYKALLSIFRPPSLKGRNHRVTSLRYCPLGQQMLASYAADNLYIFDSQTFEETPLNMAEEREGNTDTEPTLKRLRLRGDWSDTGPEAIPESEMRNQGADVSQARRTLQSTLMQRMTDVLSRMLNDRDGHSAERPSEGEPSDGPADSNHSPSREGDADNEAASESGPGLQDASDTEMAPAGEGEEEEEGEEENENEEAPSIAKVIEIVSRNKSESDAPVKLDQGPSDSVAGSSADREGTAHTLAEEQVIHIDGLDEPVEVIDSNALDEFYMEMMNDALPMEESTEQCHTEEDPGYSQTLHLQSTLSSLRNDFVNEHQVEPSVNLSCSSESAIGGVISLDVGDEVSRDYSTAERSGPFPSNSQDSFSSSDSSVHSSQEVPVCMSDQVAPEVADVRRSSDTSDLQRRTLEQTPEGIYVIDDSVKTNSNSAKEIPEYIPQNQMRMSFKGHRNARTMIKEACFYGDKYIMSGSDCGRVFAWERKSGKLVMLWDADKHVVNCVQPHPFYPILATSGIDYDVKLWAPLSDEPRFDEDMAREVMLRNEALLQETRDTITVPATFMIRMLASLNQIRRGRWRNLRVQNQDPGEDEE